MPAWPWAEPLAEGGAEFLFQVIAERAEKAALSMTTNLPFSEWTQLIPNARRCKALRDRITDRAHIIERGSDAYRFPRMLEKRQKKKAGRRTAALFCWGCRFALNAPLQPSGKKGKTPKTQKRAKEAKREEKHKQDEKSIT